MPSNDYIRCHYVGPNSIECEIWFLKAGESDTLCPIHKGSLSAGLVANGTADKADFYAHRDRVVQPLVEATKGMSDSEAFDYYNNHIAGLERKIEELKLEAMHARALKQGKLEKLSDDEREQRRKIRPMKAEGTEKKRVKSSGKLSNMTPEMAVKSLMTKVPGMTEDGARKLLGLGGN